MVKAHPGTVQSGSAAYDQPAARIERLTRDFISFGSGVQFGRFGCFEIEGADRYSDIARHLELEVFGQQFGNDADCLDREYGPYETSSLFFLVVDLDNGSPAAAMRMIRNSSAGLKTLVDMADPAITPTPVAIGEAMRFHGIDDLDRCWDGGSAVIRRPYRSSPTVFFALLRAWYAAVIREQIEHFVSILAAPGRRAAERFLRVPLVPLAGTQPFTYMQATEHLAVYAHIPTAVGVIADGNRLMSRWLRDTVGIAGR